MDKNVFITLVEPSGHEFTFLRDELMAFHKRISLRRDPETEKNKYVTVTVLYFKNKAEFTLDVSPEDVRNALEAPEKIDETRAFSGFVDDVLITSNAELEARLEELSVQSASWIESSPIASHNWEWGNPFGSQTHLP